LAESSRRLPAGLCASGDTGGGGRDRRSRDGVGRVGAADRRIRARTTDHVYDTFEGLPKPGEQDRQFAEGQYETNFDEVKNYLSGLRVSFHKGVFPESAEGMKDARFSFVHLDVDLYKSTYEALEFFYPRMATGGILISHDYVSSQRVTQSFADFFKDKPETPIELIGYQAMFVKLT